MTGFGNKESEIPSVGRISVELRSTNYKFLEVILHLPEGFFSLEEKIKKECKSKSKRERVICVININRKSSPEVFINDNLVKTYLGTVNRLKKQFHVDGQVTLDALLTLPGVLTLEEKMLSKDSVWPALKPVLNAALNSMVGMRKKEGRALFSFLKRRAQLLNNQLQYVKRRFKQVSVDKAAKLKTAEERIAFLKDVDISEEIERLGFYIKNFSKRLAKSGPVGKELDFIAQEMQRETNTIGAKSCDTLLSAKVVQIKSQIEKIREQVQNVE